MMLRNQILRILRSFENGTLDVGKLQTSTFSLDLDNPNMNDYMDYQEEVQRNKLIKYVTDIRDEENGHYAVISYISCPSSDYFKNRLCDKIFTEDIYRQNWIE
jgi:hypothetical protein